MNLALEWSVCNNDIFDIQLKTWASKFVLNGDVVHKFEPLLKKNTCETFFLSRPIRTCDPDPEINMSKCERSQFGILETFSHLILNIV